LTRTYQPIIISKTKFFINFDLIYLSAKKFNQFIIILKNKIID